MIKRHTGKVGLVVVGGGPGGFSPLFAAETNRKLPELVASGVVVLERSETLGAGELRHQMIRSDSAADAFLHIAEEAEHPLLVALREHPAFLALAEHRGSAAPLALVAAFLEAAAHAMAAVIEASPRGRVVCRAAVHSCRQVSSREWVTRFTNAEGFTEEIRSTSVLLATGAHQPIERLYEEDVAGEPLLPRYNGKVLYSGEVLTAVGLEHVLERLRGKERPRVVVVGGSASAGSVAQALLHYLPSELMAAEGSIRVLHRNPLRIFYASAAEAEADGYTDWVPSDICSLTGRIHRLGGLRFDSRDVIMRAMGVGHRQKDTRVLLQALRDDNCEECRKVLDQADLIVAAIGYIPRALEVLDGRGEPITLASQMTPSRSLVDVSCRVLDAQGAPLAGLYAIGLASGRPPAEDIGGEAGFMGQVNSLWLWQHIIGLQIVKQVIAREAEIKAPHTPQLSLHEDDLATAEVQGAK